MSGKVTLVGAGPGDPGLITAKGIQRLQEAAVVVYDRLINPELLNHAPKHAELIYAGKGPRDHALSQQEINGLLLEKAREGKTVVRLKGGDPFVFGRGGEELEALAKAGVPFEVVPGITSAIAAPAYAGIPVTHRGLASSFAVITGHEADPHPNPVPEGEGKTGSASVDWGKVANAADTLVLLMGVENLPHIVRELMAHGRPPETPVALVRWGTWSRQETVTGTLATIEQRLQGRSFKPPAVIVVGQTAGLRDHLRWFDNRPLYGKRVLVTRARDQASKLSELLREQGAETIEAPAIEIADPEDYAPLDGALKALTAYDWTVFTSANGVAAVFRRLQALGKDARAFGGCRIAAIGPATAEALVKQGIIPDLVPDQYLTEAVVRELSDQNLKGSRILLPRTDIVGEDLVTALSQHGAAVDQVIAYRTVLGKEIDPSLLESADVVTFASASTVRNLLALLDGNRALLERPVIACIGPITAKAAREAGLRVDVEAKEHTIPGLVNAIIEQMGERHA